MSQRHSEQLQLPPEVSVWKDISCSGPVVCVYFRRPPKTWDMDSDCAHSPEMEREVCVCVRMQRSWKPPAKGARTNLNLKLGTMALYNKDAAVGFPRL